MRWEEEFGKKIIEEVEKKRWQTVYNTAYSEAINRVYKINILLGFVDEADTIENQILLTDKLLNDYDVVISSFLKITGINTTFEEDAFDDELTEKQLQKEYDKFMDSKIMQDYGKLTNTEDRLKKKRTELLLKKEFLAKTKSNFINIADVLKKYIIGASDDDLQTIIEHHSLKPGTNKKLWIGGKADAHRFKDRIKITTSQWNKCFALPDNKPLRDGNKTKGKVFKEQYGKIEIIKRL